MSGGRGQSGENENDPAEKNGSGENTAWRTTDRPVYWDASTVGGETWLSCQESRVNRKGNKPAGQLPILAAGKPNATWAGVNDGLRSSLFIGDDTRDCPRWPGGSRRSAQTVPMSPAVKRITRNRGCQCGTSVVMESRRAGCPFTGAYRPSRTIPAPWPSCLRVRARIVADLSRTRTGSRPNRRPVGDRPAVPSKRTSAALR